LHSEVETLDRIKILRDLRRGEFDVLIGINLLAKDWTFRKCRCGDFWMPIRKDFCGATHR